MFPSFLVQANTTLVEAIIKPKRVAEKWPLSTKGYVTFSELPLTVVMRCIVGVKGESADKSVHKKRTKFKISE